MCCSVEARAGGRSFIATGGGISISNSPASFRRTWLVVACISDRFRPSQHGVECTELWGSSTPGAICKVVERSVAHLCGASGGVGRCWILASLQCGALLWLQRCCPATSLVLHGGCRECLRLVFELGVSTMHLCKHVVIEMTVEVCFPHHYLHSPKAVRPFMGLHWSHTHQTAWCSARAARSAPARHNRQKQRSLPPERSSSHPQHLHGRGECRRAGLLERPTLSGCRRGWKRAKSCRSDAKQPC